jgi:hypothetical protein
MLKKLALAGVLVLTFSALTWAATVPIPSHLNAAGGKEDSLGVVCINKDTGDPESCGGGSATLGASESHIGETGNNQITITVAQTTTAVTYTTGQAVGGLITYANAARVSGASGAAGTSGLAQSALIYSKIANTVQFDLFLFASNPSGSTCTNASAFVLAAADFDKVVGVAHVTDWTAGNTASVGQAQNLAMPYALTSATSIFACLVVRGSFIATGTADVSTALRAIRN